jgi:hypothetical protein
MSKKSINRKAIKQYVIEHRAAGKTDAEIHTELSSEYLDQRALAMTITSIPTEAAKEQYKVLNYILVGLLGIGALMKIFAIYSLGLFSGPILAIFFLLFVPLFNFIFMYGIATYEAPMYRFCIFMSCLGFVRSMRDVEEPVSIAINAVFVLAICGLCYYLQGKLFPGYRPSKFKKNKDGIVVLDEH